MPAKTKTPLNRSKGGKPAGIKVKRTRPDNAAPERKGRRSRKRQIAPLLHTYDAPKPPGARFSPAAANRAVRWIETNCRHHKGRWAGEPLIPHGVATPARARDIRLAQAGRHAADQSRSTSRCRARPASRRSPRRSASTSRSATASRARRSSSPPSTRTRRRSATSPRAIWSRRRRSYSSRCSSITRPRQWSCRTTPAAF